MTRPTCRGEWARARETEREASAQSGSAAERTGDRRRTRWRRPSRESFSKVTVGFDSGGERCSGWLYRPDSTDDAPVVVLSGGLAGERTFGLPAYAERLAAAGYAALLFDYRNHGDSDGDPRNLVSPARQRADWEAALDGVRDLDGVDASRLVLWGVDLGGGHVLDVAADDPGVRAVVSQTPILSGRDLLTTRGYGFLAKAVLAGVRDRLQSRLLGPYTVPIADDPGALALVSTPGGRRAYLDTVPDGSEWENETPARSLSNLVRFSAGADAEDITCPALLVGGTRDDVVATDAVRAAAADLANATYLELPLGHFDGYEGPGGERVVGHVLAFLDAEIGC